MHFLECESHGPTRFVLLLNGSILVQQFTSCYFVILATLARVEKLTRAVLSSDDGGVPLHRFPSDYQRMTKTTFPWREYGFSSARDMLLSMENIVEFKFSDEENKFYLVPAHVTMNGNERSHNSATHINEEMTDSTAISETSTSRIQHSSINSNHSVTSSDAITENATLMPLSGQGDDMFAFDHYGRVSIFVSQTKEKAERGYWNVSFTSCSFWDIWLMQPIVCGLLLKCV